MDRLSELMAREFTPEAARIYTPTFARMAASETKQPANAAAAYQVAVFNFLFEKRDILGIKEVWTCRNVRIDGILELDDGGRVGLEVKYRMNWKKASQAGQQLDWFRNHPEGKARALTGGVVFFEEFNEDWARRSPSRHLENGWNYWYVDHQYVGGLRVHLVRFRDGKLESFEDALDAARSIAGPS